MKKVEQLKAGMEVWIKFSVEETDSEKFPFRLPLFATFTEDCKRFEDEPPYEMYTIDENEIPELKGVEMEVSDDGVIWDKLKVLCKYKNEYISTDGNIWLFARPIQKTFDLTNVPEHLLTDELKQYLR